MIESAKFTRDATLDAMSTGTLKRTNRIRVKSGLPVYWSWHWNPNGHKCYACKEFILASVSWDLYPTWISIACECSGVKAQVGNHITFIDLERILGMRILTIEARAKDDR